MFKTKMATVFKWKSEGNPMSQIEIVPLKADSVRKASRLLSKSFLDNPSSTCILDNMPVKKRRKKLYLLHLGLTKACIVYGHASAVLYNGELAGVSLVYPPGSYPFSIWAWLCSGMGGLVVGPRYTWRYATIDSHLRKKHIKEKHWYLYVLAVANHQQGKGLGSVLVRRLSEQAGHEDLPCYLETDKPENINIYKSLGYEVIGEDTFSKLGGLTIWYMLRPSRKSKLTSLEKVQS